MILAAFWSVLEAQVFPTPSTPTLFNPYAAQDDPDGRPNAHLIRRDNLRKYLAASSAAPSLLLVGEAPGWRGCRFSGVPFTSEAQLAANQLPFAGQPSGRFDQPLSEQSATILWRCLRPHHPRVLVWNCIPYHPHRPGEPLSNRTPGRAEIHDHAALLARLLASLPPVRVAAVGRSAERSLAMIGVPAAYVRHPSHGGARAFEQGVEALIAQPWNDSDAAGSTLGTP